MDRLIEAGGLMKGLLVFVDKQLELFVKSNQKYKEQVEQDIIKTINVIDLLLQNEDSKHICLPQIKDDKCTDIIVKMKNIDKEMIGENISLHINNLLV